MNLPLTIKNAMAARMKILAGLNVLDSSQCGFVTAVFQKNGQMTFWIDQTKPAMHQPQHSRLVRRHARQ